MLVIILMIIIAVTIVCCKRKQQRAKINAAKNIHIPQYNCTLKTTPPPLEYGLTSQPDGKADATKATTFPVENVEEYELKEMVKNEADTQASGADGEGCSQNIPSTIPQDTKDC